MPMPSQVGVAADHVAQVAVGAVHRGGQPVEQVAAGRVLVEARPATPTATDDGHLAGGVPAHAVGDDEQPRPGVPGVLVDLPEQPDVGAGGVAQRERHRRGPRYFRSSTTVLPMRIGTPILTGVGPVTLVRSR